uniref:Uncharacterized protein n=1 Tax=viral metagenome TaxID=1070528 RepID=A0A6M3KYF6_9ZZZZ
MSEPTQGLIEQWSEFVTGTVHYTQACDSQYGKEYWPHLRTIFSRMVKKGLAESVKGRDGYYRFIKKKNRPFEWWKADPNSVIDLRWPYSPDDDTSFGLENVKIYPSAVIIISGASNWGKTCMLLNFIMENMDNHEIYYWTNELSEEEFADRMSHFNGRYQPLREDGMPKFGVGECFEEWQDVIVPDAINVIDYLDPGENPYYIGVLIDKLRQKIGKGILVIAIQKKVGSYLDKNGKKRYIYSDYGTGGQYSEHRARLVIHLDPMEQDECRVFIKKAKGGMSGKKFACRIVNHGSQFHEIRELDE